MLSRADWARSPTSAYSPARTMRLPRSSLIAIIVDFHAVATSPFGRVASLREVRESLIDLYSASKAFIYSS